MDRPSPTPSRFPGRLFDGRSARPQEVGCTIEFGELLVHRAAADVGDRHVLREVFTAEPLLHAPRDFRLKDGSVLRIDESPVLAAALAAAGVHDGAVVRWQRAWPASLVALVVLVASAAWLYFEGVPLAADWAAGRVPAGIEQRLGHRVLDVLDRSELQASGLPPSRQSELMARFRDFEAKAGLMPARIEFRKAASGTGINAFALPGGTIVFLDGLVELARVDDDMLVGVLAHEAGHQHLRHMTRSLFRALSGIAIAGVLWGDYSSVAGNAAVLFGELRYSRGAETEADDFAIAALQRAGVPPDAAARLFALLDGEETRQGGSVTAWMSTHPPTAERVERARQAASAAALR